jgi:predicted nucleotidyltransferase
MADPLRSQSRILLSAQEIEAFCHKWEVQELALFGSVLRDDFSMDSDVDVLVTFDPEARRSLFDLIEMQDELEALLHRKVDLVSRGGLRNPFRRREILGTREVVYAAA